VQQAVWKEGLRAPLFFSLIAISLSGPVAAQDVGQDELRRCASLESPEQKLACFEALAGNAAAPPEGDNGRKADPAPAAATQDGSMTDAADAPPAPPAVQAAPAAPLPAATGGGVETAAVPEDLPTDADGVREDAAPVPGARGQADDVIVATVTRVTKGFNDRLTFYLDDGQVWRQQTRGYIQYPKDRPFEIEISKGMMGDYRLRVGGEGRMTRIVRVE